MLIESSHSYFFMTVACLNSGHVKTMLHRMVWWKLFHCPWCWSADWNPILLFEAGLTLKRPWLLLFVSALFIGHDFHYFLCSCIFPQYPLPFVFFVFYRDECSVQIDLTMKYTIYKNHVNYQNNTLIITHFHSVFSLSFLTRQPWSYRFITFPNESFEFYMFPGNNSLVS